MSTPNKNPFDIYRRQTKGFRDRIFKTVLNLVEPWGIVEVGTMRDLSKFARVSDGWALLFFGEYDLRVRAKEKVSCLPRVLVADRDPVARDIIEEAISHSIDVMVDGISAICEMQSRAEEHDAKSTPETLVYLDGSDDPKQMNDQFNWCDPQTTSVLCDDFDTKGTDVRRNPHFIERGYILRIRFQWADGTTRQHIWSGAHQMAFIPSRRVYKRVGRANIPVAFKFLGSTIKIDNSLTA